MPPLAGVVTDQFGREVEMSAIQPKMEAAPLGAGSLKPLAADERYTVAIKDVTFRRKAKKKTDDAKVLLDSVSVVARPGEVTAIMGPSGSGKTLLLSMMAGRVPGYEGRVLVNGRPRHQWAYRYQSYVGQGNELLPALTVRETLTFAAATRAASATSQEEIDQRVEEVIAVLGLGICADTRVGSALIRGISGGQKRRLSIGVELVSGSSLIFLDAPTAGLDATTTLRIMESINMLARSGRTIVMTIDQPSARVTKLIDKFVFLGTGGKQVFTGTPERSLSWFKEKGYSVPEQSNPTDYFVTLINTDFPEHAADVESLSASYAQSDELAKEMADFDAPIPGPADPTKKLSRSAFTQFKLLLVRNLRNSYRDPMLYLLRIGLLAGLAICMGTFFFDVGERFKDTENRLLFHGFVAGFFCFMQIASLPAFLVQRDVFVRELNAGSFGASMWVLANFLASVPWNLLQAITSSLLLYAFAQLRMEFSAIILHIVIMFFGYTAAEGFMILISAQAPSAIVGLFMAAANYGTFVMFAGFFLPLRNTPRGWRFVYWISLVQYVFNALMWNDFRDLTITGAPTPDGKLDGRAYLDDRLDLDENIIPFSLGMLTVIIVFFQIGFWLMLRTYKLRHYS